MYKEKIVPQMRKICFLCGKEPKKSRIVMKDVDRNNYGNFGKRIFCNKTHARKWLNRELKRIK